MSPLGKSIRVRRTRPIPDLAVALPQPIFAARRHLVVDRAGQPHLCQLGKTYALSEPVDWLLANECSPSHLERLAFHYLEFLESIEPALAESIVLDWIEQNPPWQPGYWLDTWNSYAISVRTVCLMQWLGQNPERTTAESGRTILGSVVEQIRFLSRNLELDIRGNHLMKNIKSLLWAGRFFVGREAESWFHHGLGLLRRELRAQFLGDGMHFELSPAYHCQVFADVLECVSVLDDADRDAVLSSLRAPAQAIADLTHPDGLISLFNDAGLRMAYSPDECLLAFESLGGERPRPRDRFAFEESGFYGARFDRSYLIFDCGPSCCDSLPAHGHGDILAFEWTVDGRRVIVDAGVREYEVGPERAWNRSTRAHNTVTVGDRDQCEFLRNFRVGHRAHGKCLEASLSGVEIELTGCYTAHSADGQVVDHTRRIRAGSAELLITDEVKSSVSEPAKARLLLNHDCHIHHDGATVRIRIGETTIRVLSESAMSVVPSKWSPDFGAEFATSQIEFDYGMTPCTGSFCLRVESEC